jgi:hypothetical protein
VRRLFYEKRFWARSFPVGVAGGGDIVFGVVSYILHHAWGLVGLNAVGWQDSDGQRPLTERYSTGGSVTMYRKNACISHRRYAFDPGQGLIPFKTIAFCARKLSRRPLSIPSPFFGLIDPLSLPPQLSLHLSQLSIPFPTRLDAISVIPLDSQLPSQLSDSLLPPLLPVNTHETPPLRAGPQSPRDPIPDPQIPPLGAQAQWAERRRQQGNR